MIQIRPVSDLQSDYNSVEKAILENKQTMYLTKNGYGSIVMMSLENYAKLTEEPQALKTETSSPKSEHVEIISRPKKLIDEDDE